MINPRQFMKSNTAHGRAASHLKNLLLLVLALSGLAMALSSHAADAPNSAPPPAASDRDEEARRLLRETLAKQPAEPASAPKAAAASPAPVLETSTKASVEATSQPP